MRNIQKYAEILEDILEKDIKINLLNVKEFNAINNLLLELTAAGYYKTKLRN